ncbi:alpha/beta hydrolase family protein [Acrocarpospora catenulata]|uniref:alpha/beta hydrolase family protein n=1 Tax=Acrocarpospora catenulata TaxID=2836182 RepID=UPI001BDA873D|nr:prolyl oligopeptidase family serine peptidase [Acrocarpospora catenulata]
MSAPATVRTVPSRISFAFAQDGSHAACLTGAADGRLEVESWRFTPYGAERRVLPTGQGESTWTQLLCRRDGRVVLTRPGAGFHRLVLVTPSGERPLATVPSPAVRLAATPGEEELALAFSRTPGEGTAIYRVLDTGLEKITELPGIVTGGHPLGPQLLGLTHHGDAPRPITLDLATGSCRPIPGTGPGQHLLAAGDRLLLAGLVDGRLRLGHALPGEAPVFPDTLEAIEGTVAPMAAAGQDVALRVDLGARSHLVVYTPGEERIRTVATPPGIIHTIAAWGPDGLRFPFSAPAQPGGVATVDPATGRWELAADGEDGEWADAEVHRFPGPDGPIEAVVYGDWRRADHLVVSLHGGPEAAAQLGFDPFLQRLAAAGVAVVAPNYRGSTGYGQAHQQALHGAWGGPDLADIRHLGRQLAAEGRTLMLHGTSYGAFLALLAAAADPWLWDRCAAVAPFLSGPSLHEEGSPAVRALIERLGGREAIDDELGPRDLVLLCHRIAARLLIVHGCLDEVIPVSQSQRLCDHLRRTGRDFTYVESPTGGHDPTHGPHGPELIDRLVGFLRTP